MSLFDEFDRLTPDPGKDSRIPPERKVEPSLGPSRLPPPMPPTESPAVRPVDSIRFSLRRGAVIAIVAGTVAAAALLYAGGFLTAYVVLQPADEVQAAKNRKELPPPPLVDADRPKTEVARQKEEDSAGPLKVLMSPETSGGQAVVARQSDVLDTKPPAAPPAPIVVPSTPSVTVQPPVNKAASVKSPPKPVAAPLPPAVQTEPLKPLRPLAPPQPKAPQNPPKAGKPIEPGVAVPLPPAPAGLSSAAPALPPKIDGPSPVVAGTPPKVEPPSGVKPAKPASLANSASPVVPGSVGYTVQLGAFSSDSNAKRLLTKMSADIPGLRVEAGNTPSGRTLYYLRAGFYSNRGEAKKFAARLKSEKKIKSGYVIRVKAPSPAGGN